MTRALRDTITDLAAAFAASVLNAIRQMSLDEILEEAQRTGGTYAQRGPAKLIGAADAPARPRGVRRSGARLARRSQAQIEKVAESIVTLLEQHPEGLRSEELRELLKLDKKEMPRPIKEALRTKKIWSEGEKRSTTYYAGAGAPSGKGGGKRGKRGAAAQADAE